MEHTRPLFVENGFTSSVPLEALDPRVDGACVPHLWRGHDPRSLRTHAADLAETGNRVDATEPVDFIIDPPTPIAELKIPHGTKLAETIRNVPSS